MKIAVLLSDTGACGSYRMVWPAQAVKHIRQDWDISLHPPGQVGFYADQATGQLHSVTGLPDLNTLDLIVVQRVGKSTVVELMRRAQVAGCAVVLDNDDAMWAIDRENAAWLAWNSARGHHWRWTDRAAQQADLCTNTTVALARRYGNGRSAVLPNVVPTVALDCEVPAYELGRDRPVVGWSGQLRTHPRDPAVVGDAVRRVAEDTGCRVMAQPDAKEVARMWQLAEVERLAPNKIGVPYYAGLRMFDVALVPLEDSLFNRAKSSLKALECAAAGCAVVASPTPANKELAQSLPILLAASPAEWYDHIMRLVRDPVERRERGEQAREIIRPNWTFEQQAERWVEAWERAVARRRRLTPRALVDVR